MAPKKQVDPQSQGKEDEQTLITTGETDFELPPVEDEDEVRADEQETEEKEEEEKPSFRFDTLEGYDKAYTNAEKKMQEALAERDRALRMVENLSMKEPARPTEPEQSPAERIMEEAFEEIDRLDQDDPDYRKKLSKIYARADIAINEQVNQERETKADKDRRVTEYAEAKAKEAGFDSDFLLDGFWAAARIAPRHLGLDDQIDFAIKKVKEFTGHIEQQTLKRVKEEEEERRGLRPMSKGARGGPTRKAEVEEPASLTDILKVHLPQARTVRKEDVY